MTLNLRSRLENNRFYRKGLNTLNSMDKSILSLSDSLSPISQTASYLKQKKYLPALANITLGTPAAISTDVTTRGLKVSSRAKKLKVNPFFGFTRGLSSGIKQNRRPILNTVVPGSITIGENLNNAINKSKFGESNIGKTLTTDITKPLYKKIKPGRLLRKLSRGLFNNPLYETF